MGDFKDRLTAVKNSACLMQKFSGVLPALEASPQKWIPDPNTSMACESARLLMSVSGFSSVKCVQFGLFHIALRIGEDTQRKYS